MFGIHQNALRLGLAAVVVIGVTAVPTVVLASNDAPQSARADSVVTDQAAPRSSRLDALAAALGVKPDALKAAMAAARTAVGKPAPGTFKDKTARDAFQQKYVAALAANLKLDVTKVQAALDAAKLQGARPGQPQARPRTNPLDTAAQSLGVTPEVLRAAMTAARMTVGKPDASTHKDKTARDAFRQKYVAAIATNLKLDVPKVEAALKAARPTPSRATGSRSSGHRRVAVFGGHQNGQAPGRGTLAPQPNAG